MSNPILITSMRATTATLMADGSTHGRCQDCGERVLLAPSSQDLIKQRPGECRVICMECLRQMVARGELTLASLGLAAPAERIASELATAVPNTWRERN